MTKKEIIVEIDGDGNINMEAIGFKGKACEVATKDFEDALGTLKNRKYKKEYKMREQKIQAKIGQGLR